MSPDWSATGFSTRAIHVGSEPDPATGAVVPSISVATTFLPDGVGGLRGGYEYSRSGNPTRDALQAALAAVEQGTRAFAFASGLAAEDVLLRAVLRPGDHLVTPDDAYGGSHRLFARVLAPWGVEHTPVRLSDVDAVRAAIRPGRTKLVWVETPTNPLLRIADIGALADVAHDAGALLVVDNTFATPYLQTPLVLGADVVVHSTTKYVGGHSDVVGGALVLRAAPGDARAEELAADLGFLHNAAGAVAGPFDAWLTLRGLKTLAVRMERHTDSAERVAEWLTRQPGVTRVHYPGLPEHPGHLVASKQMRRPGGMVSFQVGSPDAAAALVARTGVFLLAESLGGIESLIEVPGRMTHASVAGSALEVPGDLVRLSVGLEDVEDLLADLEQALAAARA